LVTSEDFSKFCFDLCFTGEVPYLKRANALADVDLSVLVDPPMKILLATIPQ